MTQKTVTLEKIYEKLDRMEKDILELKHSNLPVEKISKKELKELEQTSREMRRGKYITAHEAIAALRT